MVSDNHLCVQSINVNISGTTSCGTVVVTFKKVSVSIPISLPTIDFLYYPNLNIKDIPQCLCEVLYVVAFFASSFSSTARRYVLSNSIERGVSLIPTDAWGSFIMNIPDEDFLDIEWFLDNMIK